jgi:hypothetical protein
MASVPGLRVPGASRGYYLAGSQTNLDLGGVYPSAGRNKAYLDLTEQVSSLHEINNEYYITLYAVYDPTQGPNLALLDNIKLVAKQ